MGVGYMSPKVPLPMGDLNQCAQHTNRPITLLLVAVSRSVSMLVDADVKRFEVILGSKQPDLLDYCNDLATTRDCLQAIRSVRNCKQHIQLAETIIANR